MASKVFQQVAKKPTIYVNNIPWTVGSKELKNYFEKFGSVVRANVVFDKDTGLNRGFGFVTFRNEESIHSVFQKVDHSLDGKKVEVKNRDIH